MVCKLIASMRPRGGRIGTQEIHKGRPRQSQCSQPADELLRLRYAPAKRTIQVCVRMASNAAGCSSLPWVPTLRYVAAELERTSIRTERCGTRGGLREPAVVFTMALVILPNVARVILVSGSPRFTQLKTLNTSARNFRPAGKPNTGPPNFSVHSRRTSPPLHLMDCLISLPVASFYPSPPRQCTDPPFPCS